ncbi:MAG: glutamyl-tRNA reductase [Candidatus Bathyarchaeota archaeon]|nr:glutamyl-tRNA reductase [Candidatus Bathyarchaeota archaeon]
MHSTAQNLSIVNVRITHKTAHVQLLEDVAFKEKKLAYSDLCSLCGVQEAVLIQTCNRVEIYLASENTDITVESVVKYLAGHAANQVAAAKSIEYSVNRNAILHLLRVVSGLESMVIGEDQVINQVWNAFLEAEEAKTVGPVLKQLFNRAVNLGRRVRSETAINKGAVSVGSAAVELAEKLLGSLNEKKILVMGSGETGTLITKAMARRCLSPVFIANRTYERAARLADELCGRAVKFDKLGEVLVDADVVFCSTSAPHYLLTKTQVSNLITARQNKNSLIIIDISNPRNVEGSVGELPNVSLYNIDDLTLITKQNKQERQKSAQEAAAIINEEIDVLERAIKADSVRIIISDLLSQTEETRQRELTKAFNIMRNLDDRNKKIVGDLTCVLLKQTFLPVIENLRKAAANDESELIDVAIKLFEVKRN